MMHKILDAILHDMNFRKVWSRILRWIFAAWQAMPSPGQAYEHLKKWMRSVGHGRS